MEEYMELSTHHFGLLGLVLLLQHLLNQIINSQLFPNTTVMERVLDNWVQPGQKPIGGMFFVPGFRPTVYLEMESKYFA